MATLAEKLRQQINVSTELPWLAEDVMKDLQSSRGRYVILCDSHIREIKRGWWLPGKYFTPVCEWARREGLHAGAIYNSYGVKHIEITL